jgi:hypothetical protein
MIGRIGFRRLLPTFFTLVHVALLTYASTHRYHTLSSFHGESQYHYALYQETSGAWEPMEPAPEPGPKLAIVLNLPASVLAIPITFVLFRGSDMGLLDASVPFVPLVWYGIGRWLDRLLGYTPPQSCRAGVRRHRIFAVLFTGLLGLSIASITPLNHHQTGDTYWVGSALVLWSALYLAIAIYGSIRRRMC